MARVSGEPAAGSRPDRSEDRGKPVDLLYERVYDQLKKLARRVRAGRAGETLNTTALVNEAYLKLAAGSGASWNDHDHFFAVAARAMRQILVDSARRRLAGKRGGGGDWRVSLDANVHAAPVRAEQLIALDEALGRLAAVDPRRAAVVEHRYFAGLSIPETARILGVAPATVERDWRTARAWLAVALKDATP
jgi:RNA polymerase sigma factor (TIGR02999 family)